MGASREEATEIALKRKQRILEYITQNPPVPISIISEMEGIHDRPLRQIVKELEEEHGIKYICTEGARRGSDLPYGITEATNRLRANFGNELYKVTNPNNDFGYRNRHDAAPAVGMNNREQIRAETKPFCHDWKLSQIERLARRLGEDPREFLLRCLTT